jgi:peptidoglycan/LPS O-acetylase OafA/YrhL
MTGEFIGLVAVVLTLGIPVAGMYTYYHVRKLRTQERLAAMARGVEIPMVADLSESARSRRAGILLCTGALGVIMAFGFIAQIEHDPEVWVPAAFAIIPMAVGIGYFLDYSLIRRDASAHQS